MAEEPTNLTTGGKYYHDTMIPVVYHVPAGRPSYHRQVVAYQNDGRTLTKLDGGRTLSGLVRELRAKIALSIEAHVQVLHPAGRFTHLATSYKASCDPDMKKYKATAKLGDTTCPKCIALAYQALEKACGNGMTGILVTAAMAEGDGTA